MIWGAIAGAIFGVVFYFRRLGGRMFMIDLQTGIHAVLIQAGLHAVVPTLVGLAIGLLIST